MKKLLIHTKSYIVAVGMADIVKQLNQNIFTHIAFSDKDFFTENFDFLITDNDIFEKIYLEQKQTEINKILIIDKDNNEFLFTKREDLIIKLNLFFNNKNDEQVEEEITEREKEIIKLVALGLTNKEIADKLFISIHTVVTHRKNITNKLSIKTISGLTIYAVLNGIIELESIKKD